MIVLDTSALCAVLFVGPDAERYNAVMLASSSVMVGAPTLFEMRQVLAVRMQEEAAPTLKRYLDLLSVTVVPWSERHADLATDAFLRFGKGQGHPASLNFGDCMAYAVAKELDAPLLYKGEDFALTDIRSALAV